MLKKPSIPLKGLCLLVLLAVQLPAVAQLSGESGRREELEAYALRKRTGVRKVQQFVTQADEKGLVDLDTRKLQRVKYFDEKGHYQTDSIFKSSGEIWLATHYLYQGDFIAAYQFVFGEDNRDGYEVTMHYDANKVLHHSKTKRQDGSPSDSTAFLYDQAGNLAKELVFNDSTSKPRDTVWYQYDANGRWLSSERRSVYSTTITRGEYNEEGKLWRIQESYHFRGDEEKEENVMVYRYGKKGLIRQIDSFEDGGKLLQIATLIYYDKRGKIIEN